MRAKLGTDPPLRRPSVTPASATHSSHIAGQAILNEEAFVRFLGLDGHYKESRRVRSTTLICWGSASDLLLWKWLPSKEKHGRAPRVRGSTQEKIADTVEHGTLKSEAPSQYHRKLLSVRRLMLTTARLSLRLPPSLGSRSTLGSSSNPASSGLLPSRAAGPKGRLSPRECTPRSTRAPAP